MRALRLFTSALLIISTLFTLVGCSGGEIHGLSSQPQESYSSAQSQSSSLVTVSSYFADGMVIQRDKPINIFGACKVDGTTVKVRLGNEEKNTVSSDGKWSVGFDAKEAVTGLTLSISATSANDDFNVLYKDVSIGDLWIMSGQSNIAYTTSLVLARLTAQRSR